MRLVACVLLVLPFACAQRPPSPYTAAAETARNAAEAQRLNGLAVAVIERNPDEAEALLRRALAADLYCGPAHNNLGTLLLRQGKLYEAAGEFEWARKLMPGHPDPRVNLALALEAGGRPEGAMEQYRAALEAYPEHIAAVQGLVRLQVRTGRRDADTRRLLGEVAMRGETAAWREWARVEMLKE